MNVTKQPDEPDGSSGAAEMLSDAGAGFGGLSNEWMSDSKGNCLKGASERSSPWDGLENVGCEASDEWGCTGLRSVVHGVSATLGSDAEGVSSNSVTRG